MKITICGSMLHEPRMTEVAAQLGEIGYDVEKPNVVEGHVYADNLDANAELKRGFIDEHFRKIDTSDAILVVNDDKNGIAHYIGGNTLIEIAYAYAQGLDIFLLNPVPEVSYADEVWGMHPIILDGDVAKLHQHIQQLPVLAISSKSPVKHSALSRGLRRAGVRIRTLGVEVASGVAEQPASIEESYEGAMNRHASLKQVAAQSDIAYYATIESGQHAVHKNHNVFGCSVVVLERVDGEQHVGIDLDVELPKSMTDRIPSEFPDAGVLVQQVYGSTLKDPFPYFTNGKLTRARILEDAVYNVAVQFASDTDRSATSSAQKAADIA